MKLKVIMCNINGLGGKRDYRRNLLNESRPDVVILSETKMKLPLIQHVDIVSNDDYTKQYK